MESGDEFELEAQRRGYRWIAGIDEAGRGPLAGPVVAAAVILPRRCHLPDVQDSKMLPGATRERLYGEIIGRAVGVGIGSASAREIDQLNVLEATRLAMRRAVDALAPRPEWLLIDAVAIPCVPVPQRQIIKGDSLSRSIAAASIVAKVYRDRLMLGYHRSFPLYKFSAHKGYATSEHLYLLGRYGPCEIHRRSFRPVLDCVARRSSDGPRSEGRQGDLRRPR